MNFATLLNDLTARVSVLLASPQQRRAFLQNYRFSDGLKQKFAAAHPMFDAAQQEMVFEGLRDYFSLCQQAGRFMVAMPSQIVDEAWHTFILFTKEYNDFCDQAFGRFLHHTPAEAMSGFGSMQSGLERAWILACRREKINPQQPEMLPRLFAIDTQLNVAGGFSYDLDELAEMARRTAVRDASANDTSGDGGAYSTSDGWSSDGCSHDGSHAGHSDGGHGGHSCGGHSGHGCGGHGCGGHGCGGGGCGGH